MKFNYSAATLIASVLIASTMAAPVADVANATTPLTNPAPSTTFDPMSGATAIASITILGHDGSSNNTIRAQNVNSGTAKTIAGAASVALPIAIISALALM
jgi:hypothetical protein